MDTNDAEHPARQKAILIIENVIEPLVGKGIADEDYYRLEDQITDIITSKTPVDNLS